MKNFKLVCILVGLLLICPINGQDDPFLCSAECKMEIVETIPDGMESSDLGHISTTEAWTKLIDIAESNIHIASYYWTLRDHESPSAPHETSKEGSDILDKLIQVGKRTENKIDIRIVKHINEPNFPNTDIDELVEANAAQARDLNMTRLIGSGILHTKMWIVDGKHLYLGSANLDWRALTQVKELGIMVTDCPCVANDMDKTFEIYWEMATTDAVIPDEWDTKFESPYNKDNQLELISEGISYDTFVSSAPPQLCANGRTTDLDAIMNVLESAEEFIHIGVMDYFPLIMFDGPLRYWGDLDNALRNAGLRGVKVKLLMAKWTNTRNSAEMFLKSLQSMNKAYSQVDIQVKLFIVPADDDQATIPYSRVNHNKYVVTEKSTHIGTSNWSGDYFIASGGVGMIVTPRTNGTNNIRQQVEDIFNRDWEYAKTIEEIYPGDDDDDECPEQNGSLAFKLIPNWQFMIIITILVVLVKY